MAAPAPARPNGIGARLTAKVGPLPVWAWALVLLVGGYLAYRLVAGSSSNSPAAAPSGASSDTGSSADAADMSAGGSDGAPPASGSGASSDNADLAGYLSGLQGSVDSLTSAVQMSPAFWPTSGDAGSGAFIPNDGSSYAGGSTPSGTTPKATSVAASSPKTTAPVKAPTATIRYYTYAPGKAPASRKGDEAPARGPAGTTLHFATGKGYYYA
jgi:hypothetical protein